MILLKIHLQQNRAMIAMHGIAQNNRSFKVFAQLIRHEVVIDAPAQVLAP